MQDEPKVALVAHALIVAAYNPPDGGNYRQAFALDAGQFVETWLNRQAEWIEVLSHVDLQPHPPWGPQVGLCYLHNVVLSTTATADRIGHFGYTSNPIIRGSDSRSVTVGQWSEACGLTNRSDRPPEAHRVLRDARAAYIRDDFRKTVVDACTAAEIALAGSLNRSHPLAGSNPDEVKAAVARANGVIQLLDLHQAMAPIEGVSRSKVIARLAGPRNDTAHGGETPGAQTAGAALQLATRIVEATSPLSLTSSSGP